MALVPTVVTPTQATAASGVATSTTSFSPSAGALAVVSFTYMFSSNTTGVTFTVADSHSNSYTLSFTPLNNGGAGATYVGMAVFTYGSAPGATTVHVTASSAGAADCLITPIWFTGQAASQAGAAFASNTSGSSGTTCEQLITPTATGSFIAIAGGVAAVNVNSTPISGTTLGSSWNDATVGNSANSGITTSAGTGGVQVNVGFTLSGTSTFGYSIAALEVLPGGGVGMPQLPRRPGRKFQQRYQRQQVQQVLLSPNASPVPLPATATANALGGDDAAGFAQVTAFAGLAAATGVAQQPTAQVTGTDQSGALATGAAFDASGRALVPAMQPVIHRSWHRAYRRRQQPFQPAFLINVSPALTASGFGTFSQVPAGSVIASVIANITWHASSSSVLAPVYELWDGTTARIAVQSGTASTSAANVDSVVFTGVAYSQLATLQLRVYASYPGGNSGAQALFDAVSLSVEWVASFGASVFPGTLAVVPAFPAPAASGVVNASISATKLTVVPAFPAAVAGFESVLVFPASLAALVTFPAAAASSSVLITPAVLAVIPVLPAVTDVTAPGYASAETDGGWGSPGNITGPPDGSYATWTAP